MDDYIQLNSTDTLQTDMSIQTEDAELIPAGILSGYQSLTLPEMDSVKLMNRIDTKFVMHKNRLPELLLKAKETYSVLEIDGERITPYSTVYFDTNDIQMYTMHHNGKLNRYKVRMRLYENSKQTFLEIKRKSNKGRTSKKRIGINYGQFESMSFTEDNYCFLEKRLPYHYSTLNPMIQNHFNRITLVDNSKTERITIDTGLKFSNIETREMKLLNELVIIEIKQDGACKSVFRNMLDDMHILPGSMSKYCLGMVLVKPGIKANRFKNKLRKINKINQLNYVTN